MTTHLIRAHELLLDPDPDKVELEQALNENYLYSLDLDIHFKGELIRNEHQLWNKLETLFDGVSFKTLKVTRLGNDLKHQAVVDKENFLLFIRHKNYGDFEGDYMCLISSFHENIGDDKSVFLTPDTPLRLAPQDNIIDGLDDELTITMRRGQDPTDRPARGMQSFHLLTDPPEVFRILKHFKLDDKVRRCTKATPQRPTLQVQLKAPVVELFDGNFYKSPCLVYQPTRQTEEGGATALWAHIHLTSETLPKRVIIDGIHGMVDLKSVKHRLSYHGELVSDLEPMMWKDPFPTDIPNGDLCVFMKIKIEFNFLLFGKDSYKVTYQNQPPQCSVCYSFEHRTASCDKRNLGRVSLHFEYLQKWKRLVGFEELRGETPPTGEVPERVDGEERKDDFSEEESEGDSSEGEPEGDSSEEEPLGTGVVDQEEEGVKELTTKEDVAQEKEESEHQDKMQEVKEDQTVSKGDPNDLNQKETGDGEEEHETAGNKPQEGKQEGEEKNTVRKNLEKAFEKEAPEPIKNDEVTTNEDEKNREKLLLSSPSSILENFEDVYGKARETKVNADAGEVRGKDSRAADTEGWEDVKKRRNKNRRQKDQQHPSDADSSSASSTSETEKKGDDHSKKQVKRKASPKENDVKKTGSGRKIGNFAEKTKVIFFEEHLKKQGEAASVGSSVVKKEKVKRDLLAMEQKFYKLLFQNDSGTDPLANENWNEMKKALDNTRMLLEKKDSSS